MLKNMGSAILSEIFTKIMIEALQLVEMPDWMPIQYRHPSHNFEMGGTWPLPWWLPWEATRRTP